MREYLSITSESPAIRDHHIMGRRVLPGLAYIDMLFQLFQKHGHDYRTLELRNVSILHPLLLPDDCSVLLEINSTQCGPQQWKIAVTGQMHRHGRTDGESERYITAEMHGIAPVHFAEKLDISAVARGAKTVLTLDDIYATLRESKLTHGDSMRAQGRLYVSDSALHVACAVNETARSSARHLMFHPALIDASAVSGVGAQMLGARGDGARGAKQASLVLPLLYESFRASELLQEQSVARIALDTMRRQHDLSYCTLEFFNSDGRKVAELKNLIGKALSAPEQLLASHEEPATGGKPNGTRAATAAAGDSTTPDSPSPAPDSSRPARGIAGFLRRVKGLSRKPVRAARGTDSQQEAAAKDASADSERAPPPRPSGHPVAPPSGAVDAGSLPDRLGPFVRGLLAERLGVPAEQIDPVEAFHDLGVNSAGMLEFVQDLEDKLGLSLPRTLLFEHETLTQLCAHLLQEYGAELSAASLPGPVVSGDAAAERTAPGAVRQDSMQAQPGTPATSPLPRAREPIAIVGMAGRFPGAHNVREFWENLKRGTDCITEAPAARLDQRHGAANSANISGTRGRWGGFIDAPEEFDHEFFGFSYEEVRETFDVREQLLLEVVWELMEDSGYTPELLEALHRRRVGLYIGASDPGADMWSSWLAPRVSDWFELNGPSIVVDTQSASSMTAIHLACEGIARGDCDAAVVASAYVVFPKALAGFAAGMGMLASSREARCFFASDGMQLSEGAAAVCLKRLCDAERDNDRIYAVIAGTAVNCGRSLKAGASRPQSPTVRSDVLREALRKADVDARSVSYVEAMMTGQPIVDLTQLTVLKGIFTADQAARGSCTIGSVESNIGHSIPVSGLAQLIKVALQLRERVIVPTIGPNGTSPVVPLDESPFRLSLSLMTWDSPQWSDQSPRRAMLTSHGMGGMNGCAVLQEYEPREPARAPNFNEQLVLLSARTADQLRASASRLQELLRSSSDVSLADVAYTLRSRRAAMEYRLAIIAGSVGQLVDELAQFCRLNAEGAAQGLDLVEDASHGPTMTAKNMYYGRASSYGAGTVRLVADKDAEQIAMQHAHRRDLRSLALIWVQGRPLPTRVLDDSFGGHVLSLPTYPFQRAAFQIFNPAPQSRAEMMAKYAGNLLQ